MTTAAMAAFVARAGTAVVRRLANAQAVVLGHSFAVHQRQQPELIGLGGGMAQSQSIVVDALLADVQAAPVCLLEGECLQIDGQGWKIVARTDRPLLGQVTLQLEPVQ